MAKTKPKQSSEYQSAVPLNARPLMHSTLYKKQSQEIELKQLRESFDKLQNGEYEVCIAVVLLDLFVVICVREHKHFTET